MKRPLHRELKFQKSRIVEEKTPVQEVTEEESEDYMTEEDLRSAEEEFLEWAG